MENDEDNKSNTESFGIRHNQKILSFVWGLSFAIIVLGVLGIFEGKEIATVFAAIAGYVLGKASSKATEKTEPKT